VDGGGTYDDAVYNAATLGGENPNQRRWDFAMMDRPRDEGGSIDSGRGHGRREATGWQRPLSYDAGMLDSLRLPNTSMLRDERQGKQRAYHEALQRQIDANAAREIKDRNAQDQKDRLEDQNSIGYSPWGRPGGGAPTAKYTYLYEERSKSESPKKTSRTDKGVVTAKEEEGPEMPWFHSDEQAVRRRRDAAFRDGLDQQTEERRLLKAQRKQADDEKEQKMEAKVRRELLEAGQNLQAPIADDKQSIFVDEDNRDHDVPGSGSDHYQNENSPASSGRRLNMPVFKIVQNTSYQRGNEVAYERGVDEGDLSARSMTDTFYRFKEGLEKAITLRREMSRGRRRRQRSTLHLNTKFNCLSTPTKPPGTYRRRQIQILGFSEQCFYWSTVD
jgi:hypothetical protein